MTPMRIVLTACLGLACAGSAALATAPASLLYWVSMRGITEDAQATTVGAHYAQTAAATAALTACGHTFYLTPADRALVQAAQTAGDTVQIHAGEPGTAFADAGIVCLVQVDQ